jgi:hypothetical protein
MLQALQDVWPKAGDALLTRTILCAQAALELLDEFDERDVQAGEQPVNRPQRGTVQARCIGNVDFGVDP